MGGKKLMYHQFKNTFKKNMQTQKAATRPESTLRQKNKKQFDLFWNMDK